MKHLRILSLTLLAGFTMASCGTTQKAVEAQEQAQKTVEKEKTFEPLPQKIGNIFKGEKVKNWQHTDPIDGYMPGMSTEKAYETVLKDLPAHDIIVAVVDAGIDINHPDLKEVIWTNEDEIPGNGIDDDKNGFIDDIHGWNFLGNKDGRMVGPEQLEHTRIVAKYRKQWKDKSIADIPSDQQEMFKMYQRAEKELAKDLEKAKKLEARYKFMEQMINGNLKILKEALKVDSLSKEKVEALKTVDPKVIQAKQAYLQGMNEEYLEGFRKYVDLNLNYQLNVDFNGRIQGDDPDTMDITNYGNPNVIPPNKDELHGTHVAGIIAQVRHNGIGGDGVADHVKIMSVRAVPDGDEYDKDIALAFKYAVDNGAKVINTSFGKYYSPHKDWVWDAIKYAAAHDVLIVNAAGNDGKDMDQYGEKMSYPNDGDVPGGKEISDNFLNVGAMGPNYGADMVAPFSNYGKNTVDIFSPGRQIYATVPFGEYKYLQGTSMASPDVAGVAAVIRSRFPELTAGEVKKVIMDSAIQPMIMVIKPQEDDYEGKPEPVSFSSLSKSGGMVNLYNAVLLAKKLSDEKKKQEKK